MLKKNSGKVNNNYDVNNVKNKSTMSTVEKQGFLMLKIDYIHSYPQVIHKMWITLCKAKTKLCKVDNCFSGFVVDKLYKLENHQKLFLTYTYE